MIDETSTSEPGLALPDLSESPSRGSEGLPASDEAGTGVDPDPTGLSDADERSLHSGYIATAISQLRDESRDRDQTYAIVVSTSSSVPPGTWGRVVKRYSKSVVFRGRSDVWDEAKWVQAAYNEVDLT